VSSKPSTVPVREVENRTVGFRLEAEPDPFASRHNPPPQGLSMTCPVRPAASSVGGTLLALCQFSTSSLICCCRTHINELGSARGDTKTGAEHLYGLVEYLEDGVKLRT